MFQLDRGEITVDAGGDPDACWDPLLVGDEDQDGIPDGCDPCPADPDPTIVNTDRDELGEACDPRPMEAGQTHVTFDDLNAPGGWQPRWGLWSFSGGRLTQSSSGVDAATERMIPPARHPGMDVVIDPMTSVGEQGIYMLLAATVTASCTYQFRGAPTEDRFVLEIDGREVGETTIGGSGAIRIQLFQTADGSVHCRGARGLAQVSELGSSVIDLDTTVRIGLRSTAPAAFSFVSVFATL